MTPRLDNVVIRLYDKRYRWERHGEIPSEGPYFPTWRDAVVDAMEHNQDGDWTFKL